MNIEIIKQELNDIDICKMYEEFGYELYNKLKQSRDIYYLQIDTDINQSEAIKLAEHIEYIYLKSDYLSRESIYNGLVKMLNEKFNVNQILEMDKWELMNEISYRVDI